MTVRSSLAAFCGCLLFAHAALAACIPNEPLTRPDSRYQAVNSDASEVKDLDTGLVWQRCVMGQKWDGKACTGDPVAQGWNFIIYVIDLPDVKLQSSDTHGLRRNQ